MSKNFETVSTRVLSVLRAVDSVVQNELPVDANWKMEKIMSALSTALNEPSEDLAKLEPFVKFFMHEHDRVQCTTGRSGGFRKLADSEQKKTYVPGRLIHNQKVAAAKAEAERLAAESLEQANEALKEAVEAFQSPAEESLEVAASDEPALPQNAPKALVEAPEGNDVQETLQFDSETVAEPTEAPAEESAAAPETSEETTTEAA